MIRLPSERNKNNKIIKKFFFLIFNQKSKYKLTNRPHVLFRLIRSPSTDDITRITRSTSLSSSDGERGRDGGGGAGSLPRTGETRLTRVNDLARGLGSLLVIRYKIQQIRTLSSPLCDSTLRTTIYVTATNSHVREKKKQQNHLFFSATTAHTRYKHGECAAAGRARGCSRWILCA